MNFKNLAFTLKDQRYEIMYNECLKEGDYNFLLLDGALLQMKYEFDNRGNLVGHILSFYPHPNMERYQDNPQEYEKLHYGNEFFTDIVEGKILASPLRFDYSQDHTDIVHPRVHACLGNYKDCRIPINKPISPNRFVSFILRNFYYRKFEETKIDKDLEVKMSFNQTITSSEKQILHFAYD